MDDKEEIIEGELKNKHSGCENNTANDQANHGRFKWIKRCGDSAPNWIIAVFTIVIGIVGCLQWKILSGQLEETAKEFRASHRPWVSISEVHTVTPLTFSSKGATVAVIISLKNSGASPAIGVFDADSSELIIGHVPSTANEAIQIIGCGKMPKDSPIEKASDYVGHFIVSGATFKETAETWSTKKSFSINMPVEVWFPTCVRYKDEMGDSHATGAIWRYITPDGKTIFNPKGTIKGKFIIFPTGNTAY